MNADRSLLLTLALSGAFLIGSAPTLADEAESKPGSKDVNTDCVQLSGVFTGFQPDLSCKMALSDHRSSEYFFCRTEPTP